MCISFITSGKANRATVASSDGMVKDTNLHSRMLPLLKSVLMSPTDTIVILHPLSIIISTRDLQM